MEDKFPIPVDYQLLPKKFFEFKNISLPLVFKKWLDQLNEISSNDQNQFDDSNDEHIPLIKLKHKLKKTKTESCSKKQNELNATFNNQNFGCKKKNLNEKCNKKSKKSKVLKKKEPPLVNRKPGRPRKTQKNENLSNIGNVLVQDGSRDDIFENFQLESVSLGSLDLDNNFNNESRDESAATVTKTAIQYNDLNDFNPDENESTKHEEKNDLSNVKNKTKRGIIKETKGEDGKSGFTCLDCGKSFSAVSTLNYHSRIHTDSLFKCTNCDKRFTTKYLLKCHMRVHNGDLFKCKHCDKGYVTAELLKVHIRSHTGERPFKCGICNKTFTSASKLAQHKLTHAKDKSYLCSQCGALFDHKRSLEGHMLIHAEKAHICNECGKRWARKSDLKEHMRIHTGIKPYCCDLCPQEFTQSSSLKRHKIVIHSEVEPIQCSVCNKLFRHEEYFKRHAKKHETDSKIIKIIKLLEC